MIFHLHYIIMNSSLSTIGAMLAIYLRQYTDASQTEIGVLLMTFPFVSMVIKPLFCCMADRSQSHRLYLISALVVEMIGYLPFAIIPFFPTFYVHHPRWSWYVLVLACHVGNGGLGVAWSLGDCLAMNMAQKKGTPFGRMRLMGTIGWGVYGLIIGHINEVSVLPKFTPAYFFLHMSLVIEIIMMACWRSEDFVMFDTVASKAAKTPIATNSKCQQQQVPIRKISSTKNSFDQQHNDNCRLESYKDLPDICPYASLSGTWRKNAAHKIDNFAQISIICNQSDEKKCFEAANRKQHFDKQYSEITNNNKNIPKSSIKGSQMFMLKRIFMNDGRLVKYILLFAVYGCLKAPRKFLFLSWQEQSATKGYNFSQLAGYVLISQASAEMFSFLMSSKFHQANLMSFGLLIMAVRFIFYGGWYYTSDISPYWATVGEAGFGVGYAIFCTIRAEVALMFANKSRLFIPELRRLGYLSELSPKTPKEVIEAEERSVKMALRATMQAIFDGFMNGFGQGVGSLLCGVLTQLYSYVTVWQLFAAVASVALVSHELVEISNCRWSDRFEASQTCDKSIEIDRSKSERGNDKIHAKLDLEQGLKNGEKTIGDNHAKGG